MPKHPIELTHRVLIVVSARRASRPLIRGLVPLCALFLSTSLSGQSVDPYPNAVTDRLVHTKTAMAPPPVNTPFTDPDFGSTMTRVTDTNTDPKHPGRFYRTEGGGGANVWSADTGKFYVIRQGGAALAYSFDTSTLNIGSLPAAPPGQGLVLPFRAGASFSLTDPDLMYGTTNANLLQISSYRFSTGVTSMVVDTTTCGVQPPLQAGPKVRNGDDVTPSLDDNRLSISEGGPQFDQNMFVVVYDKKLGCRWYNTQTGQISGQWGPSGAASTSETYLIGHARLSRSGKYVWIGVPDTGWFVWDVATLNVTPCLNSSDLHCFGYTTFGYNSVIQDRGLVDAMDIVKRPFADITQATPLVWPLPPPHYWTQDKHFTWSNVDVNDSTPVCASSYGRDSGEGQITQPFEAEIFCIETDGIASTIWRFAHNRASSYSEYFNTQPLGSVSRDGHFFLFTSGWDEQVGTESDGTPRSDVWIVALQ